MTGKAAGLNQSGSYSHCFVIYKNSHIAHSEIIKENQFKTESGNSSLVLESNASTDTIIQRHK